MQIQAASVKGWRDIVSLFSDKPKSPDSDTVLSPSLSQIIIIYATSNADACSKYEVFSAVINYHKLC